LLHEISGYKVYTFRLGVPVQKIDRNRACLKQKCQGLIGFVEQELERKEPSDLKGNNNKKKLEQSSVSNGQFNRWYNIATVL